MDPKSHMPFTRREILKMATLTALGSGINAELFKRASADEPATADESNLILWYRQAAESWIKALPMGNGRLGAMVFGGVAQERIGLNEDTLWSGGPYNPVPTINAGVLEEIRQLSFAGKLHEAQKASAQLQGTPHMQAAYQTVGELQLNFADSAAASDYRRELDLDTAIVTVTYTVNRVTYKREVFVSPVDQAVVIHLSANQPGKLNFDAAFSTPMPGASVQANAPDTLVLSGRNGDLTTRDLKTVLVPSALTFQSRARVLSQGGNMSAKGDKVSVAGADTATILVVAATSYQRYDDVTGDPAMLCADYLAKIGDKAYADLRRDHVANHQRFFRRVKIDVGSTNASQQPTDERIRNFSRQNDPALAALTFQFGRYLLLSCSRPGGQPANLQGMWNDKLTAPWDGKYTININTEMNYWPAQTTNLPECEEPLLRLVTEIAEAGAHTAKGIYNAAGWVCHHNTDLWRATAPIDGAFYGQWTMGGAWLCNQLYQRYLFDGDRDYLGKLYPLMKGAARFFFDFLVEEPTHQWLVTCPAMSPEHEREHGLTNSPGPTMDMQILRELFSNCAQAASDLGQDADFVRKCKATRARLAPNQIGQAGQLQEWLDDIDTTVPEIKHRHMSPLYGLYPGSEITEADPTYFAGARKLAEMRGVTGQGMGWAIAWRSAIWARLLDAENAYSCLAEIISRKTEENMFDMPSVQLDGSFGRTAAIAEMLLQSHAGAIHLLPALPQAWPAGFISGLRARGGFEVDIAWSEGKLTAATLRSRLGRSTKVRYGDEITNVELGAGATIRLGPDLKAS